MTRVPAWMGLTTDHLIENCPHRTRSRTELEHHGWWQQCITPADPDSDRDDLCGWCVRVWKARNPEDRP